MVKSKIHTLAVHFSDFKKYPDAARKMVDEFFNRMKICLYEGFESPGPEHLPFLFISGPVGTGKTQLCTDMVARFFKERQPLRFFNTINHPPEKEGQGYRKEEIEVWGYPEIHFQTELGFFELIKLTWDLHIKTREHEIMDRAREIEFLVIDDMGVKDYAPWVYERYFQILNYRYCNLLPTIISSNLDYSQLAKIEERIASRANSGLVIELTGEDRRTG